MALGPAFFCGVQYVFCFFGMKFLKNVRTNHTRDADFLAGIATGFLETQLQSDRVRKNQSHSLALEYVFLET